MTTRFAVPESTRSGVDGAESDALYRLAYANQLRAEADEIEAKAREYLIRLHGLSLVPGAAYHDEPRCRENLHD